MKYIYFIVFISGNSLNASYAQKTLSGFEGNLTFKESYFYFPLSRTVYDTAVSYSYYELGKMTKLKQFAVYNTNKNEEIEYTPIRFCKNNDSIFYKYADPFDKDHDTICVKLFSLKIKDTIRVAFCYKLLIDTIRGSDKNKTLTIHTECDGDDDELKTYRLKDTTFVFKDYKLDCYAFEQKAVVGHYKDIYFTRVIAVDKHTLIPIDVKEYNFYSVKRSQYRNIEQGKKLLTYHQKLMLID